MNPLTLRRPRLTDDRHFAVFRPIWQEMGDDRHASWVESGDSNVFVDGARLIEMERLVTEKNETDNLVIVPAELVTRVTDPLARKRWLFTARDFRAKNGKSYRVAAYSSSLDPSGKLVRLIA